jgi:hypothetical protein
VAVVPAVEHSSATSVGICEESVAHICGVETINDLSGRPRRDGMNITVHVLRSALLRRSASREPPARILAASIVQPDGYTMSECNVMQGSSGARWTGDRLLPCSARRKFRRPQAVFLLRARGLLPGPVRAVESGCCCQSGHGAATGLQF